ncbi:hypothetical protein [Sphingomonas echinoides]|uniref:hypothetical protein n=1 Tax=Sphingomonas echinoides TaxID=59803 RepID=UPI0024139399|nr:hypothetical protein [Sphingomonas echinoides]
MNTGSVFTRLFRFGRLRGVIASTLVALAVLPAPLAAQSSPKPAAKVSKAAKSAADSARKTAPKVAKKTSGKVKTKTPPKVVVPLVEPVRSEAAQRMVAWVATAHDNGALPYIIIDKQAASLSMFSAKGVFLGETPVLLGIGIGDDSSPGVGAKELSDIGPAERTTPAGRFVAKFGMAFGRQRVLWVDYANSVALHAVITTHKKERRVERLLSPSPEDNRISFGCINVGTSFYAKQLRPLFLKKGGVVYILPDTKPLEEVFPSVRLLPYLTAATAD